MASNDQTSGDLTPSEVEALNGDYKSSCGSIAERFQAEDEAARKSKGWRKLVPNLPIMLAYGLIVIAGTGFWIAKDREFFGLRQMLETTQATLANEEVPEVSRFEEAQSLEIERQSTSQDVASKILDKPSSAVEIGTGGKLAMRRQGDEGARLAIAQVAAPQAEVPRIQKESAAAKPAIESAKEAPVQESLALIKQGSYVVQLASVGKLSLVEPGWKRFKTSYDDLLSGFALHTEEAEVSGKTYYRIQTGPFSTKEDAIALCTKLKARDQDCFVTKKTN